MLVAYDSRWPEQFRAAAADIQQPGLTDTSTPDKLSEVRTVDAKSTDHLDIATPEGKPFLVAYGSTDLGAATVKATVTGLSLAGGGHSGSGEHGIGVGLVGEAARRAGSATLAVTGGKPTEGKLLLGIYLPES